MVVLITCRSKKLTSIFDWVGHCLLPESRQFIFKIVILIATAQLERNLFYSFRYDENNFVFVFVLLKIWNVFYWLTHIIIIRTRLFPFFVFFVSPSFFRSKSKRYNWWILARANKFRYYYWVHPYNGYLNGLFLEFHLMWCDESRGALTQTL